MGGVEGGGVQVDELHFGCTIRIKSNPIVHGMLPSDLDLHPHYTMNDSRSIEGKFFSWRRILNL